VYVSKNSTLFWQYAPFFIHKKDASLQQNNDVEIKAAG